jgi:hypothetical protein
MTEKPHVMMDTLLHSKKCMVWCSVAALGIVEPVFFKVTVNTDIGNFLPGMGVSFVKHISTERG